MEEFLKNIQKKNLELLTLNLKQIKVLFLKQAIIAISYVLKPVVPLTLRRMIQDGRHTK